MGQSQALAEYLEWIIDPLGGGLSIASANLAYWAVRSARKHAGWHDAERDPVTRSALAFLRGIQSGDELPRSNRAPRRFTRDELVLLTEAIEPGSLRGLRDRALLWLGYEGSLKSGELTSLKWRDIHFDEFDASVRVRLHSRKVHVVTLYEQEEPLEALLAWRTARRRRDNEQVFSSIPWNDRRISSNPLSTSDVTRIVARRALEARLGKATASTLLRPQSMR